MQVNAIKNPDNIFVNTECFREEAKHFIKYGYYCPDPWGSPAWKQYWNEQLKRCKEGYTTGGVYVTGHHYGYLNFGQIKVTPEFKEAEAKHREIVAEKDPIKRRIAMKQMGKAGSGNLGAEKEVTFPSFWSMDYNYFHVVDIARWGADLDYLEKLGLEVYILPDALSGGWHIIVGKSRRKGFSYKNGWIAANNYNTVPNSVTIIGAYDKKYLYPEGTMGMTNQYINFFNEHTGWAKARDFVNKQEHKKASYEEKDENQITVEKGYKSTVMAVSFQDNPEAAIGKDGSVVEFEEAGKFPNLKESFLKTKPAMEDGIYTTGQMFVFGTGGDMESGTTDFAHMFYHPLIYKLLPFKNIWDKSAGENSKCGFFVPDYWNKPGFIDGDGNSDNAAAKAYEDEQRKQIIDESVGSEDLNEYIQQYPQAPEEAFLQTGSNDFPIAELMAHLNDIRSNELDRIKGTPAEIMFDKATGKPKFNRNTKLNPITRHPSKETNKTGCVMVYEEPVENPPVGMYKAGYDPYRQDQSEGESLGAFYIYKSANSFSYTHDIIVAEYIGRPATSDTYNRNVQLLAEMYNVKIMHENEIPEVISFFRRKKKLHLLASQPDGVISKNVKRSKVARTYGIHMNKQLKDAGEKYIKRWLLEERDIDAEGKKILNLHTIFSVGLLEELIAFDRKKGNFDRIMAFMMVMFQLEEEDEGKIHGQKVVHEVAKELLEMDLHKRN